MKKIFIGVLAFSFIYSACINGTFNGVQGEGPIEKDTRNASGFKAIDMMCSGDVFVKKGDAFKVVVETHKNIAGILETKTSGDVLEIRFKNNTGSVNYDKLNIYIEAPNIEAISLSGSGNVVAETALTTGNFSLDISGSGNISVKEGTYKKVNISIGGSGNINMGGFSESAVMQITGSGNVNAGELKVKSLEASVTGSGDISCYAESELDASVTGSGDIRYKGTPTVKSSVTGSGSVEKD